MVDARRTLFHSRIRGLLESERRGGLFRIDSGTIGISDGALARRVLAQRPMLELERTVFKPVRGLAVCREAALRVMRALAQDVRTATAGRGCYADRRLQGMWPKVGHRYVRTMIFPTEPWQARLVSSKALDRSVGVLRIAEALSWMFSRRLDHRGMSALAGLIADAADETERRLAVTLYRRAVTALCSTVVALVTNALWLASPLDPDVPVKCVLLETLRLLPPAWMLLRKSGNGYASLHESILETDDILVFPLLAHRRADAWDQPDAFKPQRWIGIEDPDRLTDYLPFGHGHDSCWARHLVLPLAERILAGMMAVGLAVDPRQSIAKVPMAPLLTVSRLNVVGASR